MTTTFAVAHVVAHGEPYDIGFAHGTALKERLRAFLDDGVARLNHLLPTAVSVDSLSGDIAAHRAEIIRSTPRLAEELSGFAAGAGLTPDEATLLQLRREIMGYQRIPTRGDCTTYARPGVLAQTVDLNGNLDDQIAILEVGRGDRRALVLSFAGLLGYLGVNSRGLAVGLNLVLGGQWGPGVPPYLAIRHLLDSATSVESAVSALRSLPFASSRTIVLADATETAWVEVIGDEYRVMTAPESVHTNHFLAPDFTSRDELNVFARNSSLRRLRTAESGLRDLPADAAPDAHFAVLSQPPICVGDDGDIRRERTVAAVVLDAKNGALHLRPGNPRLSGTRSFTL
ncbi:C45 family peptidase [Streptomyces sp. NBC_00576]|uniref:C45 family peptidase n=1 Tax=Streptomyces sp. NBC_00576 TaxID=2903665 RepID=UPI002E82137E|nr:C45 family peptidase [Streptomyces sp. NBC_00576]WUB73425.1 C45 family peptidase [Streptomyces sp. NBC_00576]